MFKYFSKNNNDIIDYFNRKTDKQLEDENVFAKLKSNPILKIKFTKEYFIPVKFQTEKHYLTWYNISSVRQELVMNQNRSQTEF